MHEICMVYVAYVIDWLNDLISCSWLSARVRTHAWCVCFLYYWIRLL